MTVNPDHFPIASGVLYQDGRDNELVIVFEDVSVADSGNPGTVESVRITYSEEDVLSVDGYTEPLVHTWERGEIELSEQ